MEFSHSHEHSRHLWDTEWWLGEPMWSTAVKNGLKAAVSMWPGKHCQGFLASPFTRLTLNVAVTGPPQMADKTRPTYFAPFQNEIHWHTKRDQIANWLDMSDDRRPQLIMSYLPEVSTSIAHPKPTLREHRLTMLFKAGRPRRSPYWPRFTSSSRVPDLHRRLRTRSV